ncbi:hypothetical protein MNAN1_003840 [Malassezia nana]|uniref:Uncharacterized protein n=1 Tax=Malassezia nana TaxID=180528 RepID=A0AAF0J979_9BASI|nr:hypothetical protein MNAN1_003840 [Malassezia nana]
MLSTARVAHFPPLYAGGAKCTSLARTFVADAHGATRDPETGARGQVPTACEDARLLPSLGMMLLSCDPGRFQWNTFMGPLADPTPRGALWVLGDALSSVPQRVDIVDWPEDCEFHPLGLDVYERAHGEARVFVVNQRSSYTTIEVLDLVCDASICHATYVRSIAHPSATHTANSVHAISPHALLVTNTYLIARRAPPRAQYVAALATRMPRAWAAALEPIVRLPWLAPMLTKLDALLCGGWVAHVTFDERPTPRENATQYAAGLTVRRIATGIGFTNGLAVTQDDSALVVASTVYLGTYVYPLRVHDAQGRANWTSPDVLGPRVWAPTPFLPDNVALLSRVPGATWSTKDPLQGASVLVAGHPSVAALERMARFGAPPAPSWVVELAYDEHGQTNEDARCSRCEFGRRV